jgi:hypothetical protein
MPTLVTVEMPAHAVAKILADPEAFKAHMDKLGFPIDHVEIHVPESKPEAKPEAKTRGYCLLHMSGQGDDYYRLVDRLTWEWVFSPRPRFNSHFSAKENPPDAVKQGWWAAHYDPKQAAWPEFEFKRWEDVVVHVTSGSCENDRALSCYNVIDGKCAEFHSLRQLQQFMKKHDIVITKEWNGCIY